MLLACRLTSVISDQSSVFSYQSSVISHQSSVASLRSNSDEVMRIPKGDDIEDFQAFQEQCQHPRDWHNAPRDGWRESDAMKFRAAVGGISYQ